MLFVYFFSKSVGGFLLSLYTCCQRVAAWRWAFLLMAHWTKKEKCLCSKTTLRVKDEEQKRLAPKCGYAFVLTSFSKIDFLSFYIDKRFPIHIFFICFL
jgi:hypothetical protein